MRITRGKEGKREWTQFVFRYQNKNHAIVIQRTWNVEFNNPWWYTFHLFGRGINDAVVYLSGAPLSRNHAEKYAREYIKQFIRTGIPKEI